MATYPTHKPGPKPTIIDAQMISLPIAKAAKGKLEEIAALRCVSRAEIIREAIELYLGE